MSNPSHPNFRVIDDGGHVATGTQGRCRILCPVAACPEASTSSSKHFRDFTSIKNHLNDHCTGHLDGAVPVSFLSQHGYTQCRVCDKVSHTRYKGICPRCKPKVRTQVHLNSMRDHANTPGTSFVSGHQPSSAEEPRVLPSLFDIHEKFVPTIRNIPMGLRRLWAQCLNRAIAQTVWSNNEAAWTELQMLPKCTLCSPIRGGKSHASQRVTWTRNRLHRWLAGERADLWNDLPQYKWPRSKNLSVEAAKKQRQDRCISLTGEGGFSNACKALVNPPPLSHSVEVSNQMLDKHPTADQHVDLSAFGSVSSSLVPLADVDLVEQCIRSFHRLSGGGPSGLRPIHLKNCLSTEHRDEVLDRCTAPINLLAKGEAPMSLAPLFGRSQSHCPP